MSTSVVVGSNKNTAGQRYRAAFERLMEGRPEVLPEGTPVSQNNVAKEAGCDPSAFKKARFPSLVAEVQQYVESHKGETPESKRQQKLKQRRNNRETRNTIADLRKQHNAAVGLLADANLQIVELAEQLADLRRKFDELKPSATTIGFPKRDD